MLGRAGDGRSFEYRPGGSGHGLIGEGAADSLSAAVPQPMSQLRVVHQSTQGFGQGSGIPGREQESATGGLDQFGKGAVSRLDDRHGSFPELIEATGGLDQFGKGAVPVVQPRHGSFPELIEATGGGLLFPPRDARSLAEALGRLMDDPQLRHRLGHSGREAVRSSFSDEAMARAAWSVFERASVTGPA